MRPYRDAIERGITACFAVYEVTSKDEVERERAREREEPSGNIFVKYFSFTSNAELPRMELTKDSISVNPSSANCDTRYAYRFNNVRGKKERKKKCMRRHTHTHKHTDVTVTAEFNDYSPK